MKFVYQYRTPDNKQHKGVICAASKDAAYAALKAQGIRPGRLADAPGFLNAVVGKGKRWIAIGVLAASLLAALVCLYSRSVGPQTEDRSQIYGDPSILQRYAKTNWRTVFSEPGDRFLAAYAQPGLSVDSNVVVDASVLDSLRKSAGRSMGFRMTDDDVVRKMVRMVNGMRMELGEYLNAGGSVENYVARVIERQLVEIRVAENIRSDMVALRRQGNVGDQEELVKEWDAKNALLRDMGIRPEPLPASWNEGKIPH